MKNIIKSLFLASSLLVVSAIYAQQPVTITDGHRSSYPSNKNQFTYSALGGKSTAANADVAAAKAVVANFNITLASNGIDVTGNSISKSDLQNGAKMLAWSENIQNLALAAQASNPDLAAKDALIKLSKHLLKQWNMNQCNERDISGRNYTFYWETWKGWLCAMPLFQHIYESVATPKGLYLSGSEAITPTTNSRIGLDGNNWLISPSGTGFYIPEQSGLLRLVKETQSVPDHNVYPRNSAAKEASYADKMVSQNVAKAWISHSSGNSSYEFVVVPGTTPADMQSRVSTLGSGNGDYSILQQDATAHVVNFDDEDLSCYAVFQSTTTLPAPLVSVTKPCLLLVKPVGDNYYVSICTPDLNPQSDASRPKGWLSGISNISFKIEGVWYLNGATDKVEITATDATSTTITVSLQHGFNEKFSLTSAPTAIQEIKSKQDQKLKVFPNPCGNEITVNESSDDDIEWKIMDMAGRIVEIKKMNMDGKFDVACLNPGLHILMMNNASTGVTKYGLFIKK